MINNFMTKIFGESWRTTFWGIFSGLIAFIAFSPDILTPLPDYWEHLIKQFVAFAIAGGLVKMGLSSRDRVASEKAVQQINEKIEQKEDKTEKNEKF